LEFANFAVSTLTTGIDDTVGTLDVASGHGARFPTADFWIAVADASDPGGTGEVMLCTSRSTDTLTVTRGQDDTAGVAHSAGEVVQLVAPATFYRNEPFATFPGLKPPDTAHASDEEWLVDTTSPPTGWAWGNEGAATIRAGKRRLAMNVPATAALTSRGLFKAAPAGDISVTSLVSPNHRTAGSSASQGVGLALLWGTLATPTRIHAIYLASDTSSATSGVTFCIGANWTNFTTFSASTTSLAIRAGSVLPTWLRLVWDATAETVTFQVTIDPAAEVWTTLPATAAGPGTQPDFFGVFVHDDGDLDRVVAWGPVRVNWTPDYTPA